MEEDKKICFPFVGDNICGSNISSLLLITGLKKTFSSTEIVTHSNGFFTKYLKKKEIKYFKLKNKTFLGEKPFFQTDFYNYFKTIKEIIFFLKNKKIDIVHTNDTRIHLTWTLAARLSGCKVVWHQRSICPNWKLYKFISIFAHKIISISKYVDKSLISFNKKRSEIIYNPFIFYKKKNSKHSMKKKILKKLKIHQSKKIILYVGNMREDKRPLIFLKIAERLQKKLNGKAIFIMFGAKRDDKIFSEVLKFVKKRNYIFYLGFKDDISNYMYASDLLIAPYKNEPFGRTLVESMLLRTPVLASNSGAHREIIINNLNGFLFKKNKINSISQLVFNILKNKIKIKKVIDNAYQISLLHYSISQHVKKVNQVYNEL